MDAYDALRDAESEARYDDDPTLERDDEWREKLASEDYYGIEEDV